MKLPNLAGVITLILNLIYWLCCSQLTSGSFQDCKWLPVAPFPLKPLWPFLFHKVSLALSSIIGTPFTTALKFCCLRNFVVSKIYSKLFWGALNVLWPIGTKVGTTVSLEQPGFWFKKKKKEGVIIWCIMICIYIHCVSGRLPECISHTLLFEQHSCAWSSGLCFLPLAVY